MDRWIDLEGAVNVRDVGGMPVEGGGTTAPRVLIRSDNLQGLSDKDVQRLTGDLGVTTVVDLRTPAEVDAEGPGPLVHAGLRHVHLDLIPGWDPQRADVGRLVPHEQREAGDMSHFYLGYLDEAPGPVIEALRELTAAAGAVVVHCAAGKDRTGVVVALALVCAGVPREEIVADYALTAERIEAIRDRLVASSTYAEDMKRRPIDDMRPHALSMRHFLDRLDERGGPLTWLASQGFGPDEQAALRRRLTT